MIWIVEKIVVPHLLSRENRLAEVPLRISFEFAVEENVVVSESISVKVIYNAGLANRRFPELGKDAMSEEIKVTAQSAVTEHLALSGFRTEPSFRPPIEVEALDTTFTRN